VFETGHFGHRHFYGHPHREWRGHWH